MNMNKIGGYKVSDYYPDVCEVDLGEISWYACYCMYGPLYTMPEFM